MTNNAAPTVVFFSVDEQVAPEIAAGFFDHLVGGQASSRVGRSQPGIELSGAAVAVMAEVGIDITGAKTQPLTENLLASAEAVVTMGYGKALLPLGGQLEEWRLDDPADATVAAIRPIRDEIERLVRTLLTSLNIRPIDGSCTELASR